MSEEPPSEPTTPGDRWGEAISEERQAELQGPLGAWDAANAEHGDRKGPFDGVLLTGADVFWLAERVRDGNSTLAILHLETLYVNTSRAFRNPFFRPE